MPAKGGGPTPGAGGYKIFKRADALIKDSMRSPHEGIGELEALSGNLGPGASTKQAG